MGLANISWWLNYLRLQDPVLGAHRCSQLLLNRKNASYATPIPSCQHPVRCSQPQSGRPRHLLLFLGRAGKVMSTWWYCLHSGTPSWAQPLDYLTINCASHFSLLKIILPCTPSSLSAWSCSQETMHGLSSLKKYPSWIIRRLGQLQIRHQGYVFWILLNTISETPVPTYILGSALFLGLESAVSPA